MSIEVRETAEVAEKLYLPCRISRGGFPSERTFELPVKDGEKLLGISFIEHLRDAEGRPLSEEVPAAGIRIRGYVRCHVIRREGNMAFVEVPSMDYVNVPETVLTAIE